MFSFPQLNSVSHAGKIIFFATGVLLALIVEAGPWRAADVSLQFNNLLYDYYSAAFRRVTVSSQVVIVDIDEMTLQQLGQWPWPRYRLGRLISQIQALKPKAIGLDVLMPEPDRTALISLQEMFRKDFGLELDFSGIPDSLTDNDRFLADVLSETDSVTTHYFSFEHETPVNFCSLTTLEVKGEFETLNIDVAPGIICNASSLHFEGNRSGFINCGSDRDGILRRIPLFIGFQDQIYPNFGLALAMKALGTDSVLLERDMFGVMARIGDVRLPVEKGGDLLLNYPGGKGKYDYISAADLYFGRLASERIENRVVVIGSSAAGLNDFHQTIYDTNYPGVETIAVLVGSILEGSHVRGVHWGKEFSIFCSLLSGIGMACLFSYGERLRQVAGGTLCWAVVLGGWNVYTLSRFGVWFQTAGPIMVTFILFAVFSAMRYAMERRASYLWYRKLANSQQATLESLAMVVETRDYETGGHIMRTQHFVRLIAEELVERGLYADILTRSYIELLYISAPLHDIGKVGIPDVILNKPGRLTAGEFEEMKKHSDYGSNILRGTLEQRETDDFLEMAREIAQSHHEKWDGTGYPRGLAGEAIPLSGRIMALADVYDALTSERCYKHAYDHDRTMDIIRAGKGSHFQPEMVDAFEAQEAEIKRITQMIDDAC